jgi:DUF4097 and DUF4098 domain-containing protein YvlB
MKRAPDVALVSLLLILFSSSLYASCPVTDGATVIVRAPLGNLIVDTTGRDNVEVQVSSPQVQLQETCGTQEIEITSNAPAQSQSTIEWRITVPRTANLDLVAYAGSINVGDSDGNVTLRTTGGPITAGQIKGRAAIITQGGFIKSGNIGGDAELRSQGGSLEVGNVAGDADLETGVGAIKAGFIGGRARAETAGGSITIAGSRRELIVTAVGGIITIGDVGQVNAKAGGGITGRRVRGLFQGHTEEGDIRLDSAGSSVEASTGFGNIVVRLMPENLNGALRVDLQTGIGDVTVFLPSAMKATVDATVERPAFEAQRIFSDFPMNTVPAARAANSGRRGLGIAPNRLQAPARSQTIVNGGGNPIKLHTSLGKIEIRKQ